MSWYCRFSEADTSYQLTVKQYRASEDLPRTQAQSEHGGLRAAGVEVAERQAAPEVRAGQTQGSASERARGQRRFSSTATCTP